MSATTQDGWGDLAASPLGTLKENYDEPCPDCGEPVMHNWTPWIECAFRLDSTYVFLTDRLDHGDLLGLYLLTRHGWNVDVFADRCPEDEDGFVAVHIERSDDGDA